MDDTFVLKIQLGNDAMQTGGDVAEALRATADQIETYDTDRIGQRGARTSAIGYVADANGNNVGSWELQ